MTAVAIIGLIIAASSLVVSGLVARRQILMSARQAALAATQAEIGNAQPLAIDLLREFRHDSMVRRRLHKELHAYPATNGFESIDDPELQQLARSMSHWYDNVGLLVAHGMVSPEYVAGFLGHSAIDSWNLLERFIKREQEVRPAGDYQDYFEYLVRIRFEGDLRPEELRRRVMPELYALRRVDGRATADPVELTSLRNHGGTRPD